MTDPEGKPIHSYCWHRIFYAVMRWTIPAGCGVAVVLLTR